ncbi:MAG: hypothetical protein K0R62_6098 [Nonomuraea muscovyensis]|nr:hypothetical protein [Nonomuraea muscovyensis]
MAYDLPKDPHPSRVFLGRVTPDVRRIVYTWRDGSCSEVTLVRVAGLGHRWFALRADADRRLRTITTIDDRGGSKIWPAGP